MVAGEASADLHGAYLVKAVKRLCPGVDFRGIGGSHMAEAGVEILVPSSSMAVVGLTEAANRFHSIVKAARIMKSAMKRLHPDLLILIDYPEFNLYLARIAKGLRIPVLYYISPQVWAWRRGRTKKIARRVDRMAVILPFEESFYRKRGLNVDYVGHPLLDEAASDLPFPSTGAGRVEHPVIGLLPGSREDEIRKILPVMIQAAEILKAHYPDIRCTLPLARTIERGFVETFVRRASVAVDIREKDVYGTLRECHVAMVTSGTVTLDTAIMGVPMVVLYKVAPFSYWLGKKLVKVPYISLVNLIAGEKVVTELIQDEATAERLAEEALLLLQDEANRRAMTTRLMKIRDLLGKGGASQRTAAIAIEMMTQTGRCLNGQDSSGSRR